MAEVTGWFCENSKPVRIGWYETIFDRVFRGYSYWDGFGWSNSRTEPRGPKDKSGANQNKRWRGLTKEVK